MDDLQNYKLSWASQRSEVPRQPSDLSSGNQQAPARTDRAQYPVHMAGCGWKWRPPSKWWREKQLKFWQRVKRKMWAAISMWNSWSAQVQGVVTRAHELLPTSERHWGQGRGLKSAPSCPCGSKGGGWWPPEDEYKDSKTFPEVAKATSLKAKALCCWERGTKPLPPRANFWKLL